jgi:hypothetical protein
MAVLELNGREVDLALLGLAAGALWLAAVAWLYAMRHPLEPQVGPRTLDLGPEPPAVANVLVHDFRPTVEAVPATVIDLAARRFVEVEQHGPGVYFLRLRSDTVEALTAYERRVVELLRRHASGGVVPADGLTTGTKEESDRWRSDFEAEVVADVKARGLARFPTEGAAFFALTIAAVLPAAPALVASAWGVAAAAVTLELAILGWIRARFPLRETQAGLEAASRWLGVRAELAENPVFDAHSPLQVPLWDRLLAYGAALGVASGASRPLPLGAESDTHAWSAHGGRWRPVGISYPRIWPPGWGAEPQSAVLGGLGVAIAGGVALDRMGADLLDALGAGWSGLWSGALLAAFGCAILLGIAALVVAIPDLWSTTQVTGPILRLRAFESDDELRYYAAVDDGSSRSLRAFRLTAEQHDAFRQGQLVTVVATRNLGRVRSIVDAESPSPVLEGVL